MAKIPDGLEYWTCDEVAECLNVSDGLYRHLWEILSSAKVRTPVGGDGSDGTCEYPDARDGTTEDDKATQWWSMLSEAEQQEIVVAWNKEFGDI